VKDYDGDKSDLELQLLSQYLMKRFIIPLKEAREQQASSNVNLGLIGKIQDSKQGFDVRVIIRKDFELDGILAKKQRHRKRSIFKGVD
jgi:hypothetical protein